MTLHDHSTRTNAFSSKCDKTAAKRKGLDDTPKTTRQCGSLIPMVSRSHNSLTEAFLTYKERALKVIS
ncbi:UNVERIFIED_CONTAM: hypothetical protein NCL1_46997 [Trichonephila clavipes]